MNRAEFVSALKDYIEKPPNWGNPHFAEEVLKYMQDLDPNTKEWKRDWSETVLPQIFLCMEYDKRRQRNAEMPGYQPPDLFDSLDGYEMMHRSNNNARIESLLEDISGSATLFAIVDNLLSADRHAITAKFIQFAQQTYDRGGLRQKIINKIAKNNRPLTRVFGTTKFTGNFWDDDIVLTFQRKTPEGYDVGILHFVISKNDHHGVTGRLHLQRSDVQTAFSMIDDVIKGWGSHVTPISSQ